MSRKPRFLKLRHRTWYFQIDVPQDVRDHFGGKTKLVRTPGSQDLNVAQPLAYQWADHRHQSTGGQRRELGRGDLG